MSTTANTITLFGNEYPFRFGIKFQRVFMHRYKLKKVESFQSKMSLLEKMDTLEAFEILGSVVLCAIQAASKKQITIDPDDIIDYLTNNGMQAIQPMMEAMQQAQPDAQSNSRDAVGKSKK